MSKVRILSEEQQALLAAILNVLLPATDRLAGAGDLGVGALIEGNLVGAPRWLRLMSDGLLTIQLAAARLADDDFTALAAAQQEAVLRTVEQAQPLFFETLLSHAYRAYYSLPAVHAGLDFESRPPQPLGHRLPAFDPALLAQQRQRAPFWRPV